MSVAVGVGRPSSLNFRRSSLNPGDALTGDDGLLPHEGCGALPLGQRRNVAADRSPAALLGFMQVLTEAPPPNEGWFAAGSARQHVVLDDGLRCFADLQHPPPAAHPRMLHTPVCSGVALDIYCQ